MRIARVITAAISLAMVASVVSWQPVQAVVEWELVDDSVSLGMNGVSPHVEKTANGDRVWRSDLVPGGTAVSLCSESGSCTTETLQSTEPGGTSDFTVAQTPSGTRAYFKRINMQTNTQAVFSAPCLTSDCLSIGAATITSTGMQVSKDEKAWGVPDPVRLPDGRVRIYIVESPVFGKCLEKIASYISSDGISFTKEPGWRFEGGYVDTEVIRAKDGDWVMIMADIGCTSTNNQKLFVSTSTDGLTWAKPEVLTGAGEFKFDPTGYEASSNVFRIYYAAGAMNSTQVIKRATLRIKDTAKGGVGITKATTPSSKSKTITCVKGKTTRKVTGTKCPAGFKKQ